MVTALQKRFWSKVDVIENRSACWLWTASRYPLGYGRFAYGKRGSNRSAHRIAWLLTHSGLPADMDVCHSCDNPLCCNPDHLWLGTARDNIRDMDAKGRRRQGSFVPPTRRGEESPVAKLTETDVIQIRALHALGATQKSLAVSFGVSPQCVSAVCNRTVWRHVA